MSDQCLKGGVTAVICSSLLKDGSKESIDFREELKNTDLETIERYVESVLNGGSDGKVLQDIVNALGVHIGFNVEFGLYKGKAGAIGFDGYWWLPNIHLIVECKTTDAYRISTDIVNNYALELAAERGLNKRPDILLVVGRVDTGDIEAQIRGSRMDDRMSVIGVDSLLGFARTISELAGGPATDKLRQTLVPQDHTRLDQLSSLISEVVYETRQMVALENIEIGEKASNLNRPESTDLAAARERILALIEAEFGPLTRVPRTTNRFTSDAIEARQILYATSRRHRRTDQQYWYALPKKWVDALAGDNGLLLIHMEDRPGFYQIPWGSLEPLIQGFNLSPNKGGGSWHIGVRETNGRIEILLPRLNRRMDIQPFWRSNS